MISYFPNVNEAGEKKETIENLRNDVLWIDLFRMEPELLENPPTKNDLPKNVEFGPKELLLSLSPEERQSIYIQYIDKLIPASVQAKELGSEWRQRNIQDRYNLLKKEGKITLFNAALSGILGIDTYAVRLQDEQEKSKATDIAKDSLRTYYHVEDLEKKGVVSEGLRSDYADAVKTQLMAGLRVQATDPDKLLDRLGASRFRGALLTGVLDRSKLDYVADGLEEREYELRKSSANVAKHLDTLTGETSERLRKEAETVGDRWNKLGGIEKLILAGGGLYLAYKTLESKGGRIAAGVLGALYFGFKIGVGFDFLKEVSKLGGKKPSPEGVEMMPRANAMVNFLDDYSIQHLERQAIGFGILHDVPLATLAQNFSQSGPDGADMKLDVSDPLFQRQVANALDQKGFSRTRYREFFDDPFNREQVTEAMSFVFFRRAAQVGENKHKVELVLEALRKAPPGTSLSIFGQVNRDWENVIPDESMRPEFQRAHEEYIRLVNKGRALAAQSKETLGEFISNSDAFDFVPTVQDAIAKDPAHTNDPAVETANDPVEAKNPQSDTVNEPSNTNGPQEDVAQDPVRANEPAAEKVNNPVEANDPQSDTVNEPSNTNGPQEDVAQDPVSANEPAAEKVNNPVEANDPAAETVNNPVEANDPQPDKANNPVNTEEPL